jgi:MtN3 and saliva related transmembrane protein
MSINPEWVGMIAAVLTSVGYMPQALKVVREKHTKSISTGMYIVMTIGGVLWFAYGVMLWNYPIMLSNGIITSLTTIILVMKLKHG